jgi:hypothetical protein
MQTSDLPAAAVLDLWQAVEGAAPVERSLALAAAGGGSPHELARLPLGRRDAQLLALHPGALEATARCPACGEDAHFAVEPSALIEREAEAAPPAPVRTGGFVVRWRPVSSRDVLAAAAAADAGAAERVLLARCVTRAAGPDGEVDVTELPPEVREELARAMADADPLAEILVDLDCPACGQAFVADLDVGTFVWAALRRRAHGLLREVDALARSYGWTEAEVLALSERRRAAYLELATGGRR